MALNPMFLQSEPTGKRIYEFIVMDPPTPMGRKRWTGTNKQGGHFYAEKKDLRSQYHIRRAFIDTFGSGPLAPPIAGPVVISFHLWHPCPASKSKKWRKANWMKPLVDTKPDMNNVLNQICDALTGYAWVDDKLVCGIVDSWKYYAIDQDGNDESPRVMIRVEEL